MEQYSTTIGMDLGDKYSQLYVVDEKTGEELEQARVLTKPEQLKAWFGQRERARVVLEVGTHAGWVSRLVSEMGHDVLIADPRKARRLMGDEDKSDTVDAETLARFGRADPKLLKPVKLRGEKTQQELGVIRSRDVLVSSRTKLVNHVRGAVKATGQRLPRCASERFHKLARWLPEALREGLEPTMRVIETLSEQIKALDEQVERMCQQDYPVAQQLQQINGVGPITALAFVLIIEDASRFASSRRVGPYLGLCRRRWQSGQDDPELRITKAGDALMRRLLVQCAQHILGPHGQDSDLRRWGLRYAERGGKAAKKRAVVAVARRLAVLMHKLWQSGAAYEPLYHSQRSEAATIAQAASN